MHCYRSAEASPAWSVAAARPKLEAKSNFVGCEGRTAWRHSASSYAAAIGHS